MQITYTNMLAFVNCGILLWKLLLFWKCTSFRQSLHLKFYEKQMKLSFFIASNRVWLVDILLWRHHGGNELQTDRGLQCPDTVGARKTHWREDGNAFLWRQVVADGGGTHGAVAGGRPSVHHGGQDKWFCKVWGDANGSAAKFYIFLCLTFQMECSQDASFISEGWLKLDRRGNLNIKSTLHGLSADPDGSEVTLSLWTRTLGL